MLNNEVFRTKKNGKAWMGCEQQNFSAGEEVCGVEAG